LLILLIVGVPFIMWTAYRELTRVERGEHVARVSWLPESARDVSFYRSSSVEAYEFDIPEKEFLRWAEGRGWSAAPIGATPFVLPRSGRFEGKLPPREPTGDATEGETDGYFKAVEADRARREKQIAHGYYYRLEFPNGGGVSAGYDLDEGRAYVFTSSR
jgi:hypothetical protein